MAAIGRIPEVAYPTVIAARAACRSQLAPTIKVAIHNLALAIAWARRRSLAFPNPRAAVATVAAAADRSLVVADRMRAVRRLGLVRAIHIPEVARNRQLLADRIPVVVDRMRAVRKLGLVRATHRLEAVHSPMAYHIHHKLPAAMAADQAVVSLAVA